MKPIAVLPELPTRHPGRFGERFAVEVDRLSGGHLGARAAERLSALEREEVVAVLTGRLSWLSRESIELLSIRGPEELARGVAREEARRAGEPAEASDYAGWLGGLLDALSFFGS